MASDESPTLDHGIPPPETYLPGTPAWFWWTVAAGVLVVIALLVWAFRILRPAPAPTALPKRDLFTPAQASLAELEEKCGELLVSEVAAKSSLALRTYLADERAEPALYETAEEFEARQTMLPAPANAFLNELNEAKYAKSSVNEERARKLVARSRECLHKLHAEPPFEPLQPDLPIPQDEHPGRDRILALAPLGFAAGISSFLLDFYDGRDTGSDLEIHLFTWIALGTGVAALLLHLILRERA